MYRGKSTTQRELSVSGRENSAVSAAQWHFPDEYDFDSSLYSSILPDSKRSHHPDHYLNDAAAACISPPIEIQREESIAFASCWNRIQQEQQTHQDLMDHHRRILSQLREVAKQAQSLRQENVNLKTASLDLNNCLNLLLDTTPFHGVDFGSGLNGPMKTGSMGIGAEEEEGTSENEAAAKSPTSVMDSGRVQLPKSISVRSSGYLNSGRVGGKGGDCVRARNKMDSGTQKVYLKGGEKEKLELEVYNQGMLKTELCNKWQQTEECPYGDNCQFAHGIDELRPVIRHPRYKTEVCRMMLNGVPCPYGHRCHFRHTLTDEELLARETN